MVLAIPIVAIISYYVQEIFRIRSNNELKRSMVDRGLSAQDIETILNAGIRQGKKNRDSSSKMENGNKRL
jgi:hypothetical protein